MPLEHCSCGWLVFSSQQTSQLCKGSYLVLTPATALHVYLVQQATLSLDSVYIGQQHYLTSFLAFYETLVVAGLVWNPTRHLGRHYSTTLTGTQRPLAAMHLAELTFLVWLLVAVSVASPCKPKAKRTSVLEAGLRQGVEPLVEHATANYPTKRCTQPLVRREWSVDLLPISLLKRVDL